MAENGDVDDAAAANAGAAGGGGRNGDKRARKKAKAAAADARAAGDGAGKKMKATAVEGAQGPAKAAAEERRRADDKRAAKKAKAAVGAKRRAAGGDGRGEQEAATQPDALVDDERRADDADARGRGGGERSAGKPAIIEDGRSAANGNGRVAGDGASVTDDGLLELPAFVDIGPPRDDEPEDRLVTPGERRTERDGRTRRRAARARATADKDREPRRRAAKRATRIQQPTPAARRAELVAVAAALAAAEAEAPADTRVHRRLGGTFLRRLFALVAILVVPAYAYALVKTEGPREPLAMADASFMSAQLITADQRVRRHLSRLHDGGTDAAIVRTREAIATTRSLQLEVEHSGGAAAQRLQRALHLESLWLDAVGSTLSNPRSPLRAKLVTRDAALRAALAGLPSPAGSRRGGAQHLADYARSRVRATRKGRGARERKR